MSTINSVSPEVGSNNKSCFSLPMTLPKSPFSIEVAVECSTLVNAAYDMYEQWIKQNKPKEAEFEWKAPKLEGFTFGKPLWGTESLFKIFKHGEPFAFIAQKEHSTQGASPCDGGVFLVFRGTESMEDWAEDADADQKEYELVEGYGNVHHGFYELYVSMRDSVLAALNDIGSAKGLVVTGHSLGSGLSTVAVPDILAHTPFGSSETPIYHINLASPRVGDKEFTRAYNSNGVPTYRVVNTSDIVPTLPPSILGHLLFQHIGTPVDFTANYGSLAGNHSAVNAYSYALNHPSEPEAV